MFSNASTLTTPITQVSVNVIVSLNLNNKRERWKRKTVLVEFDVDNYFITAINGACNEGNHVDPEEKRGTAVKVLKLSSLFLFLFSLPP